MVISKMKACSNCGMENGDNATFCTRCGKALTAPSKMPFIDDLNITPTMKKAGIAIILNFFLFWGLGYWYLGCKKVVGQNWYMLIIAQLIVGAISSIVPFLGLIYLAANVALAYDLYEKANGRTGFVPAN